MNGITVNKEKVAEVYQNASAETKEALKSIFGHESNFISKPKPTLDDYTTIRSYEDACEALGEEPILNSDYLDIFKDGWMLMKIPSHIIALMKLETISRALWGKTWKPEPDAKGSKRFYYPTFALYDKSEINNIYEDRCRNLLLSANENNSAIAGFGYLNTNNHTSYATTNSGFRLCQETEKKAIYFGQQFIELWAEYLKFGFEVGERLR